MSPEFTAKEPGTYGTSVHAPSGRRTWSPGTSLWARNVMKLASVCGAMPNWFGSDATGGERVRRELQLLPADAPPQVPGREQRGLAQRGRGPPPQGVPPAGADADR